MPLSLQLRKTFPAVVIAAGRSAATVAPGTFETLLSICKSPGARGTTGVETIEISDYTGFPEMMDGRVKTLHPKVHGGLLHVRDNPEHVA